MPISKQAFIRDFLKEIQEGNAAIFAGAGLSRAAGHVDWKDLLKEVADDLGLDVDKEHDLVAIAQYHQNDRKNRHVINQKILEEFVKQAMPSKNHRILAKLPIHTFWTTNYDTLIEDSLREGQRISDVKYDNQQLTRTKPRRDAVVYKMHGDVNHSDKAIITKDDFENYSNTHQPFITALSGDLVSKTFLFIGCSFADPNLSYVLSRIRPFFGQNQRQHYIFIKEISLDDIKSKDQKDLDYQKIRQALMIEDLKRYNIQAVVVKEYPEITEILNEIETRYKRKTVFISGSAAEYGEWDSQTAIGFIHKLSKALVREQFRVVSGFGLGVGSAVINGALEIIYENPQEYSEEQLIVKPFPQFSTGGKELKELWREYRQRMIGYAGIAIFLFGNKIENGDLVLADGVRKEFDIAKEQNALCIPIGVTGFVAEGLWRECGTQFAAGKVDKEIIALYDSLINNKDPDQLINTIIKLIKMLIKE